MSKGRLKLNKVQEDRSLPLEKFLQSATASSHGDGSESDDALVDTLDWPAQLAALRRQLITASVKDRLAALSVLAVRQGDFNANSCKLDEVLNAPRCAAADFDKAQKKDVLHLLFATVPLYVDRKSRYSVLALLAILLKGDNDGSLKGQTVLWLDAEVSRVFAGTSK